jgi:hypothetical protein
MYNHRMYPSESTLSERARIISIVSGITFGITALLSLVSIAMSAREITADNQYDGLWLTFGLMLGLLACVVANLVLFIVAILNSQKETGKGRGLLICLSLAHLVVFGYFLISYASGTMLNF